ncbi:MAG: DUF1896 domain-containing protein [Bacteroides cellulosilyticus]|nr:DUF1896 domain-containing protein [Bacteroides cellulosilyticus]
MPDPFFAAAFRVKTRNAFSPTFLLIANAPNMPDKSLIFHTKTLSYYSLLLKAFLLDNHPLLFFDEEFIATRADRAAEAYDNAIRIGRFHPEAEELARETLYRGLHFSPFDTLVQILWSEFSQEVEQTDARITAFCLLPHCRDILTNYELTDDFASTSEYDRLYTELVGTVQMLLENGL